MFEEYNDIVTVKELCQMLKISRNTAYKLVHSGQLRYILIKKQIHILKFSVIDKIMDTLKSREVDGIIK